MSSALDKVSTGNDAYTIEVSLEDTQNQPRMLPAPSEEKSSSRRLQALLIQVITCEKYYATLVLGNNTGSKAPGLAQAINKKSDNDPFRKFQFFWSSFMAKHHNIVGLNHVQARSSRPYKHFSLAVILLLLNLNLPKVAFGVPVKPTPVKPTPVKPTPVKPTPVKPTPVKPTPVKPAAPVKPTPVKPAAPVPVSQPVTPPMSSNLVTLTTGFSQLGGTIAAFQKGYINNPRDVCQRLRDLKPWLFPPKGSYACVDSDPPDVTTEAPDECGTLEQTGFVSKSGQGVSSLIDNKCYKACSDMAVEYYPKIASYLNTLYYENPSNRSECFIPCTYSPVQFLNEITIPVTSCQANTLCPAVDGDLCLNLNAFLLGQYKTTERKTVARKSWFMLKYKAGNNLPGAAYYWARFPDRSNFAFGPIDKWDTSSVTTFQNLFGSKNPHALRYGPLDWNKKVTFPSALNWNTNKVTDMSFAFEGAKIGTTSLSSWYVVKVTSMASMFSESDFNQDLSKWDMKFVRDMTRMFSGAYAFNQILSSWNPLAAKSMSEMFQNTRVFNADISNWNVGSVTSFYRMFYNATAFNIDISNWDTRSAVSLAGMFQYAISFNARISRWNVERVSNFQDMFTNAAKFSQKLCWKVNSAVNPFQGTANAKFDEFPTCTFFHVTIAGAQIRLNTPQTFVAGGYYSVPSRDTLSIVNNQNLVFSVPTTIPRISDSMLLDFDFLLLFERGIRHSICFFPDYPVAILLNNDFCLDLDGSSVVNTVIVRPTVGSVVSVSLRLASVKPTLLGMRPKFIVFINDVSTGFGKNSKTEFTNVRLRETYPLVTTSPSNTQLYTKVANSAPIAHGNYWLTLIRADGDQQLPINLNGNPYPPGALTNGLALTDLVAGKRYKMSYQPYVNGTIDEKADDSFLGIGIVTCSCPNLNGTYPTDQTGKPINLTVAQKYGFVTVNFTDNSVCEEAYSFTRTTGAGMSISYASNYYFYATTKCGNNLVPGQSYADDLSLSRLDVGSSYKYCTQAVAPQYIADGSSVNAYKMSSDSTCEDVTIAWEASVQGLITSKASAGSIPIADVTVTWLLVDMDLKTPLSCTSNVSFCSSGDDVITTDSSGSFKAEFFVQEPNLRLSRTSPVAVLFNFTRSFNDQYDTFLVNDEKTTIVPSDGFIVYLYHLQFGLPVFVVDAATVAFTGSVYVRNTPYGAYRGCPVIEATVCAYEFKASSTDGSRMKQKLACQGTDSLGYYNLPLPIGAIVHNVTVTYFDHEFIPTSADLGASWVDQLQNGIMISPTNTFNGNDFVDTTKAPVELEVAGGRCNITMGLAIIKYRILGCSWDGAYLMQNAKTIQYVPAHVIQFSNVQVVLRGETVPVKAITDYFQDKQKTADLRAWVDPLAKTLSVNADQSPNLSVPSANITYVRFQYDGILSMSLSVNSTESPICRGMCKDSTSNLFFQSCDSLHIVNYLSVIQVNVSVFFLLPGGQTCDLVEAGTNVTLQNRLGYENSAGFENSEFYRSLSSEEKRNLQICYPLCINEVTYVDNSNAGLHNVILYTGRPEITRPYTRSLGIQVDGYTSSGEYRSVFYLASFVIQGFYKDGDGLSFAFPTHSPVMILRDPPGGGSSASYENVMTTLSIDSAETTDTFEYTIEGGMDLVLGFDQMTCVGLGAMVCLPTKKETKINLFDISASIGSRVYYWKEEIMSSISTSWSVQTSTDPWLAGSMSDIFVGKPIFKSFVDILCIELHIFLLC